MAGIGQVVLEARAAIVSYINSSFLAKFRFPVTREDVTMLKTFRQSQSYDSVRPSYLRQRDRGNYKESVACLITKASNSSHFHFPLIFCSLLSQPGSIRNVFLYFSHLRRMNNHNVEVVEKLRFFSLTQRSHLRRII